MEARGSGELLVLKGLEEFGYVAGKRLAVIWVLVNGHWWCCSIVDSRVWGTVSMPQLSLPHRHFLWIRCIRENWLELQLSIIKEAF